MLQSTWSQSTEEATEQQRYSHCDNFYHKAFQQFHHRDGAGSHVLNTSSELPAELCPGADTKLQQLLQRGPAREDGAALRSSPRRAGLNVFLWGMHSKCYHIWSLH